ncbi:hypothetical protein [Planktothrix sp. FACHB-1355]|nr:hypothetical protein [Planktothrix sp. FACHB-1355]
MFHFGEPIALSHHTQERSRFLLLVIGDSECLRQAKPKHSLIL